MSKYYLYLSLLLPSVITAQSLAEFEQFKQSYMGEFSQFKDELDRDFSTFLKQKWKSFDTQKGQIRDKKPKPVEIPVAKVSPNIREPIRIAPVDVVPKPQVVIEPPVQVIIIPPVLSLKSIKVEFLGHSLTIEDGLSSAKSHVDTVVTQKAIQKSFNALAQSDYAKTITHLLTLKNQLKLNDWAYIQLVLTLSNALSRTENTTNLTAWFILIKSGLKVRVAFGENKLFLLAAVEQSLFDVPYFSYDQQKYYVVSKQKKIPQSIYSYDGHYPKQLVLSDFSLGNPVSSKLNNEERILSFEYQRKKYNLHISYNKNTINFLSSYLQMDISEYFKSSLDSSTKNALLTQLRPIISGLSETEAVNLLLRFAQTAFHYETDDDQFGEENYLFIEETIFYPSSDCEDRSVIFAWLVQNLLKLDVVGLNFPGHIATAVKLSKSKGEAIYYKNERYTIADPTYINATVGMKMPQYSAVTPQVIPIM